MSKRLLATRVETGGRTESQAFSATTTPLSSPSGSPPDFSPLSGRQPHPDAVPRLRTAMASRLLELSSELTREIAKHLGEKDLSSFAAAHGRFHSETTVRREVVRLLGLINKAGTEDLMALLGPASIQGITSNDGRVEALVALYARTIHTGFDLLDLNASNKPAATFLSTIRALPVAHQVPLLRQIVDVFYNEKVAWSPWTLMDWIHSRTKDMAANDRQRVLSSFAPLLADTFKISNSSRERNRLLQELARIVSGPIDASDAGLTLDILPGMIFSLRFDERIDHQRMCTVMDALLGPHATLPTRRRAELATRLASVLHEALPVAISEQIVGHIDNLAHANDQAKNLVLYALSVSLLLSPDMPHSVVDKVVDLMTRLGSADGSPPTESPTIRAIEGLLAGGPAGRPVAAERSAKLQALLEVLQRDAARDGPNTSDDIR